MLPSVVQLFPLVCVFPWNGFNVILLSCQRKPRGWILIRRRPDLKQNQADSVQWSAGRPTRKELRMSQEMQSGPWRTFDPRVVLVSRNQPSFPILLTTTILAGFHLNSASASVNVSNACEHNVRNGWSTMCAHPIWRSEEGRTWIGGRLLWTDLSPSIRRILYFYLPRKNSCWSAFCRQIFHYKHIRSLQCDPEKCNHLHLEFKPFEHFWEI